MKNYLIVNLISGCDENEVLCKKSDQCLAKNEICNYIDDCPFKDDEMDCCVYL